jgi:ABC-type multidrug transport system fused ATPase/permease subunit
MHLVDFLWTLFVIYFMVIFFIMLFRVVIDVFGDHDLSGWAKAGWLILLFVFPLIGLLIYVIARGKGMAQRSMKSVEQVEKAQEQYIRDVAGASSDPAAQIAKAHDLLTAGAITQAEFDTMKAKALAS